MNVTADLMVADAPTHLPARLAELAEVITPVLDAGRVVDWTVDAAALLAHVAADPAAHPDGSAPCVRAFWAWRAEWRPAWALGTARVLGQLSTWVSGRLPEDLHGLERLRVGADLAPGACAGLVRECALAGVDVQASALGGWAVRRADTGAVLLVSAPLLDEDVLATREGPDGSVAQVVVDPVVGLLVRAGALELVVSGWSVDEQDGATVVHAVAEGGVGVSLTGAAARAVAALAPGALSCQVTSVALDEVFGAPLAGLRAAAGAAAELDVALHLSGHQVPAAVACPAGPGGARVSAELP